MNAKIAGQLSRAQMAWRAAQDIEDRSYVNLGIGIPEMAAQFVPEGRTVIYHSENGILGFGEAPAKGEEDFDLINAGKKAVTQIPGTAFFDHADSFAMIRGGHIDLAILGAFQVAENGDIANWKAGDDAVPAVGGAMDLVTGAKNVYVLTSHVTNKGEPKLVKQCTYPLTGLGVVSKIFTDLAVVHVENDRFVLKEMIEGMDLERLQSMTEAELHVEEPVKVLKVPALG